eukprot:449356-Rhodomonas_salina.1
MTTDSPFQSCNLAPRDLSGRLSTHVSPSLLLPPALTTPLLSALDFTASLPSPFLSQRGCNLCAVGGLRGRKGPPQAES